MVNPFPLRYVLPLGFLALSVLLMAVAYGFRHVEIERRNEALMLQRATGLGGCENREGLQRFRVGVGYSQGHSFLVAVGIQELETSRKAPR